MFSKDVALYGVFFISPLIGCRYIWLLSITLRARKQHQMSKTQLLVNPPLTVHLRSASSKPRDKYYTSVLCFVLLFGLFAKSLFDFYFISMLLLRVKPVNITSRRATISRLLPTPTNKTVRYLRYSGIPPFWTDNATFCFSSMHYYSFLWGFGLMKQWIVLL